MKLSLVTETYPPEINGVSMTLGRLVDGLRDRRVEVTVVAPGRPDREAGSNLQPVPGLPLPRYPELRFGLPAHRKLQTFWGKHRPDIVHIATEGPLGWSALRVAQQMAIPCVSSFHTNFHSYGSHYGYGFLRSAVLRWLRSCHNRTLLTFAPSLDLIQTLQAQGFDNLRLMARGVDTRLFGPHRRNDLLRAAWGAGPDTPVAVYVGRLAAEKNLNLVLQAAERMRRQLPDLKLVMVGDGPERRRLEKSHPDIILAGMRTGVELAEHYASADCFLFGSITETFGNVVTEAMASALPVLAYAYAAPGRFIKDGQNGFTASFNDQQAFLDKAEAMAERRNAWPSIGQAARDTLLPHSWDAIIDGYLAEIRALPVMQTALSA